MKKQMSIEMANLVSTEKNKKAIAKVLSPQLAALFTAAAEGEKTSFASAFIHWLYHINHLAHKSDIFRGAFANIKARSIMTKVGSFIPKCYYLPSSLPSPAPPR
jgi:hypothetical protein